MTDKQPTSEGTDDERTEEHRAREKAHGLTVAQRPETVEADQSSSRSGEEEPPDGASADAASQA